MAHIPPESAQTKTAEPITLRSPDVAEAVILSDFMYAMYCGASYVVTDPDEYERNPEKVADQLESRAANPGAVSVLAYHEGVIVGSADVQSRATRRRIAHRGDIGLGVLPAWQGKGIGRLLMERLIRWAGEADVPIRKLELAVFEPNIPARRLYESLGFAEEGRTRGFVRMPGGIYLDAIRMGLWVEPGGYGRS